MNRTQREDPHNPGPGAPESDRRVRMEDQQLADEFEIHIEDLKNEAIKQFDKELYEQCLGTFRFLCELNPQDRMLRDYRELCEKLIEENSSEELPEKGEILEIPDHGALPPIGIDSDDRAAQAPVASSPVKSELRFRPKSYKLVLSTVGIVILAAVLGFCLRVLRHQSISRPTPVQPVDRKASQPLQGAHSLPGQMEPSGALSGEGEKARMAGQIVRPSGENASVRSNQVLKVEPQNTKAQESMTESPRETAAQARELARAGRTSEAREIFLSLLDKARHESSFPLSSRALEEEIKKLEVVGHPVVHEHFLGSCSGQLQFNFYTITYEPLGERHHRFSASLDEIWVSEPGGKLKLLVRGRSYRFVSGSGASDEGKKRELRTIYLELTRRGVRSSH